MPDGFHRIRHYGLFANGARAENLARARELLAVQEPPEPDDDANNLDPPAPCPCCGGRMILIDIFERGAAPQIWSCMPAPPRLDSS